MISDGPRIEVVGTLRYHYRLVVPKVGGKPGEKEIIWSSQRFAGRPSVSKNHAHRGARQFRESMQKLALAGSFEELLPILDA